MHSTNFRNLTYSSGLFILAATFRETEELTSWDQTREQVLGVIYQFPMSRGRGIREGALRRTNHSPSSWWLWRHTEGGRKGGLLFHSFAFVDFAFAPSILSFTRLNRVDLRAAGIPETMIKEWGSGDEKRVRDIWWKKRKNKRENRARWETSRKLPTMPLFPPQSVGPLASSNCVSLPGAAMAKSV